RSKRCSPRPARTRRKNPDVRRGLLIAAFAAACVALVLFFHQGASGNGNSRLLTVFSLVEDHGFRGDRWQQFTNDKSFVAGHYFSDKAPLSSYVVLPFYALYRAVEGGPYTPRDVEAANHLAEVVAAAVPFAIFAVLVLLRLLRENTVSPSTAVWFSLLAAF